LTAPERVLTVIDTAGPGGAERSVLTLLPALRAHGHRCPLVALGPPYDLAPAFREQGIEVRLLGLERRMSLPGACHALTGIIHTFRPTVIHAHGFLAGLCVASTRPLVPGVARVVTFHNLGYASYPVVTMRRRLRRAADRRAMRSGMDAWIAVSGAVRDHYRDALRLASIEVIPNAVNVEDVLAHRDTDSAAIRGRLGASPRRTLLVCAGRFRHEKGHRYLVAALAELRERDVRPMLVFAGDGPLRDAVAADVAQHGLIDQVKFVGQLDHSRLLEVMSAADVVVAPSTHEGFPITVAEALLLGKPVIGSGVGGIPELVEDGRSGLLVAPSDVEGLARAIERLTQDEELKIRLGGQGSATTQRLCSTERVAEAHEQLFASLGTRRESPHA
jgi:glycosyltransferase involved in cell wall biosynthesis